MGGIFGGGHNVTNRADKIADVQINTAEYGAVVPEILGTTKITGNVIYYDDFTAHEHKDVQKVGKGGSSKITNITYTYSVAVGIGLCEGKIAGLGKVWRNKEIYQYPSSGIELTLFDGSQTKPWSYTQHKHPEKALVYEGLAYMAGIVNLGDSSALPNYSFEVKGKLLETGDGVDVNPADYIEYVLEKVGLADIRIEGIDNYRKYCREANILISSPPDTKESTAQKIINDIADLTNAYVFWSNDCFKIIPLAEQPVGNWAPNTTVLYDLTADDFLESGGRLVTYQRKDTSEAYNQITVEFINRANMYERESVSYENIESIEKIGLKPAPSKPIHYIYTKERAVKIAEQLCIKSVYGRNRYTFKLDWAFCRLEPGDLVSLTDKSLGLDKKVVIVDMVTEGTDGTITVSSIGKPPADYTIGVYDVHETDRPTIDYNAEPPSVSDVWIVQPPVDLTMAGNELKIGVQSTDGFGGCRLWVSDSGDAYRYIGTIYNRMRSGMTIGDITASASEMEIKLDHGELISGTEQDAQRGNTLCWINGECISYQTVTLLTNGNYKLSGCIRGQYGTTPRNHAHNSRFCRVDEALYTYRYRDEDIGKTIWLKCTSLNIFGAQEQDMADVEAWEYTIEPYYIPEVSGYALHTRYHDIGNGIKTYDVVATLQAPQLKAYETAEAWYRITGTQEWKYGGIGDGQIAISGCKLGETYEVKVQVKDVHNHYSQGIIRSIMVEMKAEVPNTPKGFTVSFGEKVYFNWLEVRNADIDYYEIRTHTLTGEPSGLVGRSNNTTYSGVLTSRTGTVYLYAHNPSKGYSAPAEVAYNVPAPQVPTGVVVASRFGGFSVTFDALPSGCRGANVYIDDDVRYITGNTAFFPTDTGVYSIRIAYVDVFGEGTKTAQYMVTVKTAISAEMLEDGAITANKIDTALADAIQAGATSGEQVTQIVSALNGEAGATEYSALVQLNDAIGLRVKKGDVINEINMSPEGTTIDGKYLHVTGEATFDDDIITPSMIQAGAVTADKIGAGSINLGQSDITMQAGAVTIDGTGMRINSPQGSIVYGDNGIDWIDTKGRTWGQLNQILIGKARHGETVFIDWDEVPEVAIIPDEESAVRNLNTKTDNFKFINRAVDISPKSFRVQSYYTEENYIELHEKSIGRGDVIVSFEVVSSDEVVKFFGISDEFKLVVPWGDTTRTITNEGMIVMLFGNVNEKLSKPLSYFINAVNETNGESGVIENKGIKVRLAKGVNKITVRRNNDSNNDNAGTLKYCHSFLADTGTGVTINPRPVTFICTKKANSGLYVSMKDTVERTEFKGRGTYTFTPKTNKIKIYMIGASAPTIRPTTAETTFSGNGLNFTTSGFVPSEDTVIENSYTTNYKYGMVTNGWEKAVQAIYTGVCDFGGQADNWGSWWYSPYSNWQPQSKLNLTGYRINGIPQKISTARTKHRSDGGLVFKKVDNWTDGFGNISNWASDWSELIYTPFGGTTDVYGCCVPKFVDFSVVYHKDYWRTHYLKHKKLNKLGQLKVIDEVEVIAGQTYTITIGACPDVEQGGVIDDLSNRFGSYDGTTGQYGIIGKHQIVCNNTEMFDGYCLILEDKDVVL